MNTVNKFKRPPIVTLSLSQLLNDEKSWSIFITVTVTILLLLLLLADRLFLFWRTHHDYFSWYLLDISIYAGTMHSKSQYLSIDNEILW